MLLYVTYQCYLTILVDLISYIYVVHIIVIQKQKQNCIIVLNLTMPCTFRIVAVAGTGQSNFDVFTS